MKEKLQQLNEKYCVVGWIFLLLMPFLKAYLPNSWGDENGVVENLQMLWLVFGGLCCYQMAFKKDLPNWGVNPKALWYSGAIFFVLLIGRELSWGRALFMDANGHMIQWEDMGFLGIIAHPFIGCLIFLMLYLLWRSKFWNFVFQMWKNFPYSELCLFFIFVFLQYMAEHLHYLFWEGELAEELAETGAYIVLEWLTRKTAANFMRGEWA